MTTGNTEIVLAPMVAIVGPTASGKSALAVALAREFSGEVLVCDSTQVYRGFDIGTGKPTMEERRGVPHHLLDMIEAGERFTAGEYRRRAVTALADVAGRGGLPIFTVGTGLYWRSLVEGLADAPQRCEALRGRLDAITARRGSDHLHRMLRRLDPASAARISPQDRQKLVRALEVCLLAGKPLSDVHRAGRERLEGYAPLKIGLNPPRPELRERIERRVHTMLERGWAAEVEALLLARRTAGTRDTAKPFEFIGYRELSTHLESKSPLPETFEAIVTATRRYAKRQLTWFRKEPGVHWLEVPGESPQALAAARALVAEALRNPAPLSLFGDEAPASSPA